MDEIMKEDPANSDTTKGRGNSNRKKISIVVFITLAVIGAITVYFYLRYKATHISTDDAFIEGHVHRIAAKVSGTVKKINV